MALLEKVKEAVVIMQDIVTVLEQGEKVYSEEEYQAKLALELAALSNSKDAEIAQAKADGIKALADAKIEFYNDLIAQQNIESASEQDLVNKYKPVL
jgi:hypothetical protein